jgi:hypothetical protein
MGLRDVSLDIGLFILTVLLLSDGVGEQDKRVIL